MSNAKTHFGTTALSVAFTTVLHASAVRVHASWGASSTLSSSGVPRPRWAVLKMLSDIQARLDPLVLTVTSGHKGQIQPLFPRGSPWSIRKHLPRPPLTSFLSDCYILSQSIPETQPPWPKCPCQIHLCLQSFSWLRSLCSLTRHPPLEFSLFLLELLDKWRPKLIWGVISVLSRLL